ncbi:MAG: hypothetical protein R2712_11725 [Vicinamibacterales bacterium]
MRVAAALGQAAQGLGLFERRQVLALDVLDQRELQHLRLVDVPHDDRELREAGLDGGVVAALAGDDLVAGALLADDEGLDDALLGDGRDELGQVAHGLPGLVGIGIDALDGHHATDRTAGGGVQGLDVVRVVAHPERVGQSSFSHGR